MSNHASVKKSTFQPDKSDQVKLSQQASTSSTRSNDPCTTCDRLTSKKHGGLKDLKYHTREKESKPLAAAPTKETSTSAAKNQAPATKEKQDDSHSDKPNDAKNDIKPDVIVIPLPKASQELSQKPL